MQVPEQIAVIGVDNDEVLCRLGDPPLSSVKLNLERIGYEAAALLEHLMKGKKPPTSPILIAPIGIQTRRSTDTVAIEDPLIARAMRYIQQNACSCIGVEEIANHCNASRRHIERNFTKFLGATPNEHIVRAKVARAKQLLSETDYTLDIVAEKSGFNHAAYLSVLFKKHLGETPGEYRRKVTQGGSQFSGERQTSQSNGQS